MNGGPQGSSDGQRHYRVLTKLGRGGYGTVYLAELMGSAGFQKRVAIKVANTGQIDARAGLRLLDEARMLALVRHRAIVAVEGLITFAGRPAMVMEFVDGVSLAELAEQGPVPPRVALGMGSELAQALHAAYSTRGPDGRELQLVHRDIKPANILLTPQGEVKLLDFGIARAEILGRHAHTTLGAVPGSMDYLAPERTETGGYGPEADIYALGAVLYELMRGEPLGALRGNERQFMRQLEGRLDLLAARVGRESPVLALVGNMLAYRPAERPVAREVRRDCDRLLERMEGDGLVDWAEANVHVLLSARAAPTADELTHQVVDEEQFSLESLTPPDGAPEHDALLVTRKLTTGEEAGATVEHPRNAPRHVARPVEVERPTDPHTAALEESTLQQGPVQEPDPIRRVAPTDAPGPASPPSSPDGGAAAPAPTPRPVRRWLAWISGITAVVGALTGLVLQVDGLRRALGLGLTAQVQDADTRREREAAPVAPRAGGQASVEPSVWGDWPPPYLPPEDWPSAYQLQAEDWPSPVQPDGAATTGDTPQQQPAARPATVSLRGTASSLCLKGDAGRALCLTSGDSRSVRAGTYRVSATFESISATPYPVDAITLAAGQKLTFTCSEADQSCTW